MKLANNNLKKWEYGAELKPHYSIRKLTIGAASVLLGTTLGLWLGKNATVVRATDENKGKEDKVHETTDSKTETSAITQNTQVKIEPVQEDHANTDELQNIDLINTGLKGATSDTLKNQNKLTQLSKINTLRKTSSVIPASSSLPQDQLEAFKLDGMNFAKEPATPSVPDKSSNYKTVTDWAGVKNALNSDVEGVKIEGNISASGDLNIKEDRKFTINGLNGASLSLGQHVINNNGELTLKNITVNGSVPGDKSKEAIKHRNTMTSGNSTKMNITGHGDTASLSLIGLAGVKKKKH